MLSLEFPTLQKEVILLPVLQTAFIEKKLPDGAGVYLEANFNGHVYQLNTSMNDLKLACARAQAPQLQPMNMRHK